MQSTTPLQSFEASNVVVKSISATMGAEVYISLPKYIANSLITATNPTEEAKAAFRQKIRNELMAGKVSKGGPEAIKILTNDIKILTRLHRHPHPHVIQPIRTNPAGSWYTMPLCTARSITTLNTAMANGAIPPALPASFVWHIAAQLSRALLYVHSGLAMNNHFIRNWVPCAHNDLHAGNLLLDLSPSRASTRKSNYPDLVLIDFGKSLEGTSSSELDEVRERQLRDVRHFATELDILASRTTDPGFRAVVDELSSVQNETAPANVGLTPTNVLGRLVRTAERLRDQDLVPLPAQVIEWLGRSSIADGEIDDFVAGVRAARQSSG